MKALVFQTLKNVPQKKITVTWMLTAPTPMVRSTAHAILDTQEMESFVTVIYICNFSE